MLWAGGGGGGTYPGVRTGRDGQLILGGGGILGELDADEFGVVAVRTNHGVPLGVLFVHNGKGELVLTGGPGFFGTTPPAAATTGGAHTAGGTYTAVEQAMLEACYTALQSIGLVT